jgi:hypothetical protein
MPPTIAPVLLPPLLLLSMLLGDGAVAAT